LPSEQQAPELQLAAASDFSAQQLSAVAQLPQQSLPAQSQLQSLQLHTPVSQQQDPSVQQTSQLHDFAAVAFAAVAAGR
jgi:hypothetical protein